MDIRTSASNWACTIKLEELDLIYLENYLPDPTNENLQEEYKKRLINLLAFIGENENLEKRVEDIFKLQGFIAENYPDSESTANTYGQGTII